MKIENEYGKKNKAQVELNEANYELAHVNDLIANANGMCTVKINTRWIIQLPAKMLVEYAKTRKAKLEEDVLTAQENVKNAQNLV